MYLQKYFLLVVMESGPGSALDMASLPQMKVRLHGKIGLLCIIVFESVGVEVTVCCPPLCMLCNDRYTGCHMLFVREW